MTKRIEILANDMVTVERTIIASEESAEELFPGKWQLAAEQPAPVPEFGTRISKLAFMIRMGGGASMPVWQRMEVVSQHRPTGTAAEQDRAASIRTAQTLMAATKDSVDLALPLTIAQVNAVTQLLVAAGEMTQQEADDHIAAVLDTSTITLDELP